MRRPFFKKIVWPLGIIAFIGAYYLAPFARVIEPIQEGLTKAGGIFFQAGQKTKNGWENIARGREYREKYEKIAAENINLLAATARRQSSENENRELRSLLEFKKKIGLGRQIPAKVIAANSFLGRKVLIIDRGQEDGVYPDLPVVNPLGVLVGKIEEVKSRIAKVILLTDGQSAAAVQIAGNPKIQGVLKGQNGLSLSLELIPAEQPLRAGDLVESSLMEDNTPSGLLIGKIIAVEYREGELFKKAMVAPLANLADLRLVAVILPPHQ